MTLIQFASTRQQAGRCAASVDGRPSSLGATNSFLRSSRTCDVQDMEVESPTIPGVVQSRLDPTRELILAAYNGDVVRVNFLLKCKGVNATGHLSRADAVALLGEDVYLGSHSWSTQEGFPVVYFAAKWGGKEVTEALLQAGADVAHGTSLGVQPLHMAAQEGQVEVAEMLLKHGAPCSSTDKAGWNAFHYAANHRWATWKGPIDGQLDVIRLLAQYGASLNMGDSEGYTCVHSAAQSGKAEILQVLRSLGARPDVSTVRGVTPIHVAAEGGRAEAVEALLEWCPELLEVEDARGHRPIHHAAYHGHADVAEVLIRHGASLEGGNLSVTSPLHLAVRSQRIHILVLLLAAGANPHRLDGHGWTPRMLAEECARRRQAPLEGHHDRMLVLELAECGVPLRWCRENHHQYPPAFHQLTREILCAMHPPMRRRDIPGMVADIIADDVLVSVAQSAVWPMLDERCWSLVERTSLALHRRIYVSPHQPQPIATAAA